MMFSCLVKLMSADYEKVEEYGFGKLWWFHITSFIPQHFAPIPEYIFFLQDLSPIKTNLEAAFLWFRPQLYTFGSRYKQDDITKTLGRSFRNAPLLAGQSKNNLFGWPHHGSVVG